MLTLGDLAVFLRLDKKKFDAGLDQASSQVKSFGSNIAQSLNQSLSFAFGGLIQQGLTSIAAGIQRGADAAFDSVASYEGLTLSLEALIARQLRAGDSSIEMSDALAVATGMTQQLLGWVQKLAIQSPFEDEDINKVVQLASSYRFGVQQTKQLTQSLVDAGAAGNATGAQLEAATRALGQLNLKGKVSQEELNQLNEAGFGFASTLERLGVTLDDVASGSVSATKFISAFIEQMAEESEGAAQRTMNSWTGLISTLTSMISTGLREFTTGLIAPFKPLLEALGNAAAAQGLRDSLRELGELAGEFVAPAIEWLTSKVEALPQFFERAAGFIRQFRDELSGLTAGDILAGLPGQLDQLQQNFDKTMAVMAQAHAGTVAKLQEQITQAGTVLGTKLGEINEKYAGKIEDLNERIAESGLKFAEQIMDLAEQHAKKRADIEEQIAKAIADQEEKLTDLKKEHQRRRRELTTDLMLAESEEEYLRIQESIKAEDEKYNEQKSKAKKAGSEQVAELRSRLAEEDAEYSKQMARLRKQRDKARADLQEQLSEVQANKAKEVAEVQAAYDQELAALQDKIARENQLYADSVAEQKALFEQQKADAIALANARASALGSGTAHDLAEQVKAAIAVWNEFKTKASEVWADIQKIAGVFQEQGFWAGIGAFTEWVTQKLNEASVAINTWVNDPANQEQFRGWGSRAAQTLVDGFVQVLTGGDSAAVLSANFALAFANLWVSIQTLPVNLASQFLLGFITTFTSPENIEKLKTTIATTLREANEFWGNTLAEWADKLSEWWGNKLAEWAGIITNFDWSSVGANIVAGIKSGLETAWGELTGWLSEKAASLPDWVNNPLGANSPATKLIPTGTSIVQGVQVGAEKEMDNLRRSLGQAMQSLIPAQPAAGALAGVVGGPTYITAAPTFNLPAAPAGFDRQGMMSDIYQMMLQLLADVYTKQG